MLNFLSRIGITPVGVTIVMIIILGVLCLALVFSMSKIKQIPISTSKKGFLDSDKRLEMIKNVTKIFETFNMKTIQSTTTEMMYYMCECTSRVLQKAGIKKEVYVQLDKEKEALGSCKVVLEDGKNDATIDMVYCQYKEVYKNTVTDKILYTKEYKKAHIIFHAVKSNDANVSSAKFCTQCGAPMEMTGDFYHCDYCNAHYNADAFLWTVSGMQVVNDKKEDMQGRVFLGAIGGMIVFSLIAEMSHSILLNLLVYGVDAAVFLIVLNYFNNIKKKMQGLKDCREYDALFSKENFQRRVEYLYRVYNLSKDIDVTKVKPFMDEESYKKFVEKNTYDDFYYLDNEFIQIAFPSFRIQNGKQYMECELHVWEITVNEEKQIRKKKKIVKMVLVRDEKCMTVRQNMADMIVCENCHANINMAADGVCKYCGTKIEMTKYDWCIYKIEG